MCFVMCWDVHNNIEVTEVAMATFSDGGLVANTCRGPLECDLFHEFWDLGDFFSRFTRILDKFHPPGTLFHSVSCVCFYDWYISSLEKKHPNKNPRCGCRFHPRGFSKACGGSNNNGGGFKICLKAQAGNLPKKTTLEVNTNSLVVVKEWSGGKLKLHSWMALGNCGDLNMFSTLHIC